MVRTARRLVVVAVLAGLGIPAGRAQTVLPPPEPTGTMAAPITAPVCPAPLPPPLPTVGPPACAPYEDCNGPLLRCDPLLDRPDAPPPGWFSAFEADIVAPHVKNRLTNPV